MALKLTFNVLTAFLVGSLVAVCFSGAQAQSIPKPSVPEFTVSVTDYSYDVPTTITTTTDLDGRKTTTTTPGYHMINGTFTVSIKNQPFTPYYDSDGYPINLYYQVRVKLLDPQYYSYLPEYGQYYAASNSTHTTVTCGYKGHDFWRYWAGMPAYSPYKADGTADFQVQAFIGHTVTTLPYSGPVPSYADASVKYVGQTSDWSKSQTATVPNGAYIPNYQNPTESPTLTAPTQTATQPPYQGSATPLVTQNNPGSITFKMDELQTVDFTVLGLAVALFVIAVVFLSRKNNVLERKQA